MWRLLADLGEQVQWQVVESFPYRYLFLQRLKCCPESTHTAETALAGARGPPREKFTGFPWSW